MAAAAPAGEAADAKAKPAVPTGTRVVSWLAHFGCCGIAVCHRVFGIQDATEAALDAGKVSFTAKDGATNAWERTYRALCARLRRQLHVPEVAMAGRQWATLVPEEGASSCDLYAFIIITSAPLIAVPALANKKYRSALMNTLPTKRHSRYVDTLN
jgi:hypothetical protein